MELGVSRMPIREGIRRLESEGLIDGKPHCGAAVAALRAEDVREIAQMRAAREAKAAVAETASELTSGKRVVFTGPLKDNKGKVILAAGQSLGVMDPIFGKMNYLLDGVIGAISRLRSPPS